MNELLDEIVHSHFEEGEKGSEVEARRLERELQTVEKLLVKLEAAKGVGGLKDDRASYFAAFLMEGPYAGLKGDWTAIRFQALEDFRKGTTKYDITILPEEFRNAPDEWAKAWKITSESQIIETCRYATDLLEARAKRDDLKRRLHVLYKNLAPKTAPPREEAKAETRAE